MALLLRSSSSRASHNYLRKRRKWPLSPYKAKWHDTFSQQQAMDCLRKAASVNGKVGVSPRNPSLLSTLIDSFSIYNCEPTPNAYHFVIKTLVHKSQFHQLPGILDRLRIVETFETPEWILTDLIETYGNVGKIQEAVHLFFRIPYFRCVPSVDSLNALLSVLCRNREGLRMVPQLLLKSLDMNIRIEESSFGILIAALCRFRKPTFAIEILRHMLNDGCSLDLRACSLILSTLCEQQDSSSVEVLAFLGELRSVGFFPDRVDYFNVIRFLVKKESRGMDVLDVLNQMKLDGIKPDIACYTVALSGVLRQGEYAKGEELFDEILVLGLVPDIYTYNVYIKGLCKQNNVEAGFKTLSCMEELGCKPNVITYNTLLEALCKAGELSRAKELVREMGLKGMQQNSHTYSIMIGGLVGKGEIFEACSLLKEMKDKCFVPQSSTADDVICGLCQKGLVSEGTHWLKILVGGTVAPGAKAWEALVINSAFELASAQSMLTTLVTSMQNQLMITVPQRLILP